MTAYEYILAKYAKNRHKVIILNALEARIFGLEYPLRKGWIPKAKALQITQSMIDEVREKLPNYELTQKIKFEAKKHKNLKNKKAAFAAAPSIPKYKNSKIDPISPEFLQSFDWKVLRLKIIKKYGAVCQCCGASPATGAVINVDHIKPRKLFPQLALTESNLQVLCADCNHGKGNWSQTDWRPAEQENKYDPLQECMGRMRLG